MAGREELSLIAELGIGFAGFVSIFLIFARGEGRFSPSDSLLVRSIILSSFSAVFGALFPLVANLYGVEASVLWRVSSLASLILGSIASFHAAFKHFALSREWRAGVGLTHSAIAWGLVVAGLVLLASNASGALGEPSAAPYVAALMLTLVNSATNFITIAFRKLL